MAATTQMALESVLEQALIVFIANTTVHGISLGIVARQEQTDDATSNLTLPAVIVKATREEEDPQPGTGVWRMRVEVSLLANADDTTRATLDIDWHNLMSILMWSALASQLSSAKTSFFCHAARFTGQTDRVEEDRHWRQSITFTAWCMSQD